MRRHEVDSFFNQAVGILGVVYIDWLTRRCLDFWKHSNFEWDVLCVLTQSQTDWTCWSMTMLGLCCILWYPIHSVLGSNTIHSLYPRSISGWIIAHSSEAMCSVASMIHSRKISHHIMLYDIMLYHIILYHIISYYICSISYIYIYTHVSAMVDMQNEATICSLIL